MNEICARHPGPTDGQCAGKCCTRISGLSVTRGGHTVLDNIDLHFHCGELTAVIGPNGAGKSTLLKAMIGEARYDGSISFCNAGGSSKDKPLIGYVPQRWDFDPTSPVSVQDLYSVSLGKKPLWLGSRPSLRQEMLDSLAKVQAAHLADRRLGALSGGEIQRVLLALALVPLPELLLLDEPVSGIDFSGRELFYSTVSQLRREFDLSIILVSHDLELVARYADRMVLLNKSVQCVGSPADVLADEGVFRSFGRNVQLTSPCGKGGDK